MARKKQRNRYFVKFGDGFETQVAAYLWHYYVEQRYLEQIGARLAVPRPGVVRWIPLPSEEPSMAGFLRLRDKLSGRDVPMPTFSRLVDNAWVFEVSGPNLSLAQRSEEAAEDYRMSRGRKNEIVIGGDLGRFVFAKAA